MTDDIRVFVNAAPVSVGPGATVLDAVQAWKSAEADGVKSGSRTVTDSRGLPIDSGQALQAGAILRTIARRDSAAIDEDSDADSA